MNDIQEWVFDTLGRLNTPDYIQIAILIALVWYSLETHGLRKWQKKLTQLQILQLDMQRIKTQADNIHTNPTPYGESFPIIIRKIYELGKFDPKVLYSRAFHYPLTLFQKISKWFFEQI